MRKKVSKIEFHICYNEMDDCIVRMARLIEEGYTIQQFYRDDLNASEFFLEDPTPSIHIILRKGDFLK